MVAKRFSKYRMFVPRYRTKAFIAETGDTGNTVSKAHALWECNRRIGRGNVIAVTVSSWRDSAGALYALNTLAALSLPQLKLVDGQKLTIGEVTCRRDMNRTGCDLTLMPPEAFQPEPILYMPLPQDAAAAVGYSSPVAMGKSSTSAAKVGGGSITITARAVPETPGRTDRASIRFRRVQRRMPVPLTG
jgi:hypothetical protein